MFDPTSSVSSTYEVVPSSSAARHGLAVGQATHPGRVRAQNEDHLACAPDLGLFVVADGVGGSPGGAVASRLATAAMIASLRYATRSRAADDDADASHEEAVTDSARLVAAAHQAHRMIYEHGLRGGCPGAATTMVSLWLAGDSAIVANTGDSRAYRLAGGGLVRLSRDHSALQEYVDAIGTANERARRHLENIVTRVLGGRSAEPHEVHLARHALERPEVFLLCTDGLWKVVSEPEIAAVLGAVLSGAASPQDAADRLIDLANQGGGPDNIACVVVRVSEPRL
jgi:serine/threonine protein phosphatase PrpC